MTAIQHIRAMLPDWELLIKAHPDFGIEEQVRAYTGPLGLGTSIVDPQATVEPLLSSCDLVIDLPPGTTSTLVTAASDRRRIPVIAADLDHDLLGDQYKGWTGIEHIPDLNRLEATLKRITRGTYSRPLGETTTLGRELQSTTEAVQQLLTTKPG